MHTGYFACLYKYLEIVLLSIVEKFTHCNNSLITCSWVYAIYQCLVRLSKNISIQMFHNSKFN